MIPVLVQIVVSTLAFSIGSGDKLACARYAALLSSIVVLAYAPVGRTNEFVVGIAVEVKGISKTSFS